MSTQPSGPPIKPPNQPVEPPKVPSFNDPQEVANIRGQLVEALAQADMGPEAGERVRRALRIFDGFHKIAENSPYGIAEQV